MKDKSRLPQNEGGEQGDMIALDKNDRKKGEYHGAGRKSASEDLNKIAHEKNAGLKGIKNKQDQKKK